MKQIVVPQDEKVATFVILKYILRPVLLRDINLKYFIQGIPLEIVREVIQKFACKPTVVKMLLRVGLKLDQPHIFEFTESISEWLTAQELDLEESFTQKSSFVGTVTFDPLENTMDVTLSGRVYNFFGISEKIFNEFETRQAFLNNFLCVIIPGRVRHDEAPPRL